MSKTATAVTQEPRKVPFNKIEADFGINSRKEYEGIEELAQSISEHGLLEPLTVIQNGSADTFKVTIGFRRYLALEHLKLGAKPVYVMVQKFERDIDVHLANLTENLERKDLHLADQAARFHELETGTYPCILHPGPEGERTIGEKLERKEIARRTGLTTAHIGNLIRAHVKTCPDLKILWKKHDIPLTNIVKWAALEPEKQIEEFGAWKQEKDKAKEQPAPAKTKGKEKAEVEAEEPKSSPPTKAELHEEMSRYAAKLEEGGLRGTELAVIQAKHKTLRWVLGEISRETLRRSS